MPQTAVAPQRPTAVVPYAWTVAMAGSAVAMFLAEFGSVGTGGRLVFATVCALVALATIADAPRDPRRLTARRMLLVATVASAVAGVLPAQPGSWWDDATTLLQVAACVVMLAFAGAIGTLAFLQLDVASWGPLPRRTVGSIGVLTAAGGLGTASLVAPDQLIGLSIAGGAGLLGALVLAADLPRVRRLAVVAAVTSFATLAVAGLELAHGPDIVAVRIVAPLVTLVTASITALRA